MYWGNENALVLENYNTVHSAHKQNEQMRRITVTEIPGYGNMNIRLPHTKRGHGAPYCPYSRIGGPEGLRISTRATQWAELIPILLYPVFFSFPALQDSLRHWDR